MMKNTNKNNLDQNKTYEPSSVLIGFRYRRSFQILDITGKIVDKILRDKNSPFDHKYFPQIEEHTGREKLLFNPDTKCQFLINTDDLMIQHTFDKNHELIADKDLDWFINGVAKFIIPEIIESFKIEYFSRVGIIYDHLIDPKFISSKSIEKITGENSSNITQFNLYFHRKIPVEKSLVSDKIKDYKNCIYSIKSYLNKNDIRLDYQYYFDPPKQTLRDWKFKDFFESSKSYLDKKFYPWLNSKFKNEL